MPKYANAHAAKKKKRKVDVEKRGKGMKSLACSFRSYKWLHITLTMRRRISKEYASLFDSWHVKVQEHFCQ